jgi:uncharacterized membrane protein YeaQ/YmgE (transglycosylase-associated protein family)
VEILLAFVFGGALGLVAQYTVAGRDTRGAALAPVLGALIGGLAWMLLTWAGLQTDNPWLWTAAVVAPVAVVYPTLILLARARRTHDERERIRLKLS